MKNQATAIMEIVETDRFGNKVIKLENSRLDFEHEYIFLGMTAKTIKLGEIVSEGPNGKKWIGKRAKIENNITSLKISTDNYNYSKVIDLR